MSISKNESREIYINEVKLCANLTPEQLDNRIDHYHAEVDKLKLKIQACNQVRVEGK